MNLDAVKRIPGIVLEKMGPAGLTLRQKSPEIFLGVGLAGIAGGLFLTARQTLKLPEELDIHNQRVEEVKAEHEGDEEYKKELTVVYIKTGGRIMRLYAAPAVATIVGVASVIGAHNIQSGRIAGLSAAYTGLAAAYDSYRERVANEIGEDKERDLALGIEKVEYEEVQTSKNGKEKKVKSYKNYLQPNQASLYTFIFDESNPEWSNVDGYNKSFLVHKQEVFNQKFQRQGYLFLSEVLYDLGFDCTNLMYTRTVGWCKGLGDDFVDFGLFEAYSPESRAFVNCLEPSIWLDFNVDGVIIDKVGVGLPAGILDPDLEFEMILNDIEEKEQEDE